MLLSSFLTTSVGVDDDIMAMEVLGLGQRASEQKCMGLGWSTGEAHLESLDLNVGSSALIV